MGSGHTEIEEQIERLRKGDTLAENEVKALCEKVSRKETVADMDEVLKLVGEWNGCIRN